MNDVKYPELPHHIGHAHSTGDFCWDSNPGIAEWPVNVYTADQMRSYADATCALRGAQKESGWIDLNEIEKYRMQMAGISTAALGYWKEGDSINPDYDTPALRDVARLYAKYDALFQAADRLALIDWVVGRWHAEVANRPLVNRHRRSLDDVWRQVLRHLGVDDRTRLGPTHDELLPSPPTPEGEAK